MVKRRPGPIFTINMLAVTEGGDTYTLAEIRDSLTQAGFTDIKLLRKGEKIVGIVEAKKPAWPVL